jgi:hypothetical protein
MDQADYSVLCGILFAMNYAGTAGDYTLALYTNTASNYGGTYVSVTLPTTSIPAASTGVNFQTNGVAGASGTQYMELRINGIAGTTALYLNAVTFTPNAPVQGAAISEWQSITFAVPSNLGAGSGTNEAFFRRVGSVMEVNLAFSKDVTPGTGASVVTWTMPSGYTIDTTRTTTRSGIGYGSYNSSVYFALTQIQHASSTTFYAVEATTANGYTGADFGASYQIQMKLFIPIAEWAGNGTVNLGAGAQEYYMSNSGTTATANGNNAATSTVYGPAGSLVLSTIASTTANATTVFRLTPLYPLQQNDLVVLEYRSNSTLPWTMAADSSVASSFQSSSFYGIGISISATEVILEFGNMGFRSQGATYAAAGQSWSALTTSYWRVRVCKASSPVGFGLASVGSSGLINYYYEDDTTLAACTFQGDLGGSASASIAIKITRIGRVVTVDIPSLVTVVPTTSSTNLIANTALPTWARPSVSKAQPSVVYNNGAYSTTPGYLFVSTGGILTFYRDILSTAYTNSANAGFLRTQITYTV